MQETWVWEDPLEEEMATHSNILPWKISRTEEPGGLQSVGLQRIRYNQQLSMHTLCNVHLIAVINNIKKYYFDDDDLIYQKALSHLFLNFYLQVKCACIKQMSKFLSLQLCFKNIWICRTCLVVQDFALPMQGTWIQSLVRELGPTRST